MTSALFAAFQLPYLHFTAICTCYVLLCIYFVIKRLSPYMSELKRKWNPPAPYDPRLLGFYRRAVWFWVVLMIPALVLLAFAVYLTQYQWLGPKVELVVDVTIKHGALMLKMPEGDERTFPAHGQQQAAVGIIMQFPQWMRFLGLGTYHQLVTFHSPDESEYRYKKPPPEYIRSLADGFFTFLYENQSWIFIQARYTESPYFTGSGHKIFVTHSGYIVE